MNYIIPEKIQKLIEGKSYEIDDIGKSDSKIMIFDDMVLKIQKFRAENDSSVEMMRWLEGKIPAPKVICYETDGRYQYLLMTRVKGMMACDRYYMDRPKELFELLEKLELLIDQPALFAGGEHRVEVDDIGRFLQRNHARDTVALDQGHAGDDLP